MYTKIQILLILILLPKISISATYYVTQTGNNKNSGTNWGAAWRTLQHASDNAGPGDTVIIRKGSKPYPGFIISNTGKEGSPITFMGESTDTPPQLSLEAPIKQNGKNIHIRYGRLKLNPNQILLLKTIKH